MHEIECQQEKDETNYSLHNAKRKQRGEKEVFAENDIQISAYDQDGVTGIRFTLLPDTMTTKI